MASEYLKWKYRDVRPDQPMELTKKQRRSNWWRYHKWHVLLCAAAVLIGADLIYHAVAQVQPDYQIAYVASFPLSEGEESAWESELAALGTDCNGDGRVVVQINQYLTLPGEEEVMYNYASNVKLMADLDSCESYFFLLEDPEGFQAGYEILQEDWLCVQDGMYLARRSFRRDRSPQNVEECGLLWDKIAGELM